MTQDWFIIRPGRPTDHALILESWTMTHASSTNGKDHGINYPSEQKDLIRSILSRPSTEVRVAVDVEDQDAIHGYAVLGGVEAIIPRLYYVFTKAESRHLGVGRALVADLLDRQLVYTHRPPHYIERLLPHPKPQNWIYSYFANFKE